MKFLPIIVSMIIIIAILRRIIIVFIIFKSENYEVSK